MNSVLASPFPRPLLAPVEHPSILSPEADDPRLRFLTRARQLGFRLQQSVKRIADGLLAALGILALLPVFAVIALLIRLDSPGPVFYKSPRIGKNGQSFDMFKFRTMRQDADSQRDQLRAEANLEGNLFKLKHDPRVTEIGTFLRAYSLDELPQLFNVVLGDMSLVGPRPLPPDESILFEAPYTLRFQVYPGITGLWQVSGRSNLSFNQLCELELQYILSWTVWRDILILLKTVPTVLFSRGAY